MNDYLKAAVKRYKLNEDLKIHPISESDGEIWTEIIEIFKKLNRQDLLNIVKRYKYDKDEEIRDKLLEWNTNFKQDRQTIEEGEEESLPNFEDIVELNGKDYYLKHIFSYEKGERWDYDISSTIWNITLNSMPEDSKKVPLYADEQIWYCLHEDREKDFKKLQDYFREKENINLIE